MFFINTNNLVAILLEDGLHGLGVGSEAVKSHRLGRTLRVLASLSIKDLLSQTEVLGSDLNDLIITNIRDHIFQSHSARRSETSLLILHDGTDVGKSLGLDGVDLEVGLTRVLANDHALVDLDSGLDEESTTLLDHLKRVSGADTVLHSEDSTLIVTSDLTTELDIVVKSGRDDTLTTSIVHELVTETEETTSRDVEDEADTTIGKTVELLHLTTALGKLLDDVAGHVLLNIKSNLLNRLLELHLLLVELEDDLGRRDSELVTLAAHSLDDNAELKFTTGTDLDGVLVGAVKNTDRDVVLSLLLQADAERVGGMSSTLTTGKGRVVDLEGHGQGRGVNGDGRDNLIDAHVTESGVDGGGAETSKGDDITGDSLVNDETVHTTATEQLEDLGLLDNLALLIKSLDGITGLDATVNDTANKALAEESIGLDLSHEHAERSIGVALGGGDMLKDALEKGLHVRADDVRLLVGPAGAAGSVDDGVLELLVVGIEVDEHIKDLVLDLTDTGRRTINLVDDDDGAETLLESLAEDELGLGHGTIGSVNDEADTIDHGHDTLDLTTEISVTGGIDNVDVIVLVGFLVVVDDRSTLGENGDTTLTLKGVGVHETHLTLGHAGTGRRKKRVDKSGLTVIDVRDNSNVTHELGAGLVVISTLVTEGRLTNGTRRNHDGGDRLDNSGADHGSAAGSHHGTGRHRGSSELTHSSGKRSLYVTQHL
jgi:hypothetical protein